MKCLGLITLLVMGLVGCVTPPPSTTGTLGFEDARRIVILGENVDSRYAVYYQRKYNAMVWFTPFQGKMLKNTSNFFQNGFGSSADMKALIRELKSINYTIGTWEIIVPEMAQKYFLAALKNMQDKELSKARGVVILVADGHHAQIERELARVTANTFEVVYEPQK